MIQSEPTGVETATRLWTVIVAGSSGALGRALEQAASVSPPERTLVVVTARRPGGLQALPPRRAHVLVEPLDRGSAASILFPVHWIHARDPEAIVVVFDDDAPGFRHQIAQAARSARRDHHERSLGRAHARGLLECAPEGARGSRDDHGPRARRRIDVCRS